MQFQQPDTVVPDLYNPLDWNRYGYARYNPVKYTDPTGHAVSVGDDGGSAISKCELCYDDEYYYGYWRRSTRVKIPKPTPLKSSTWTPPTRGRTPDTACSGSNWSIVCRDPSFVSSGQVGTDVAYPIYQTPSTYDGPYAEKACIHPLLCILGLGADAAVWRHYQTGTSSYMQGSYATANLNYETHRNKVGYFTEVTSVDITNQTDATLTLREVVINDIVQFSPDSTININSGVTGTVYFDPYPISGRSGSVRITFTSDLYKIIVLTANYL